MSAPMPTAAGPARIWPRALVATAIGLIGVATVATLSLGFDARLAAGAQHLPQEAVAWGTLLSTLGQSGYMYAICGAVVIGCLALRRSRPEARRDRALGLLVERTAFVFATLCVSGLAAQAIKHLLGRARPRGFDLYGPYHFDLLSMQNAFASFPSGHSTTVFAMAVALSLLVPSLRVALFTLATAIAVSRIVVQAHFLSDIVCGGLLGAVSALWVVHAFARREIAFLREDGHLVLKGAGQVAEGLRP